VLPRLYRDAVILETWEGPHNVLFTQALRDLIRFEVEPAAFVERLAGGARRKLSDELADILGVPDKPGATLRFVILAGKLAQAVGERVLDDCGYNDS
jgi:hypothetical protein